MRQFDDPYYLGHILKGAQRIFSYVDGMDRDGFEGSYITQDAVIRQFEIIGEAAKRISPQLKIDHPGIPWRGMAGMRDMLIHNYDEADLDIIWKTATESIPEVIAQIEKI